MSSAPRPAQEGQRIETLRRLQILDTPTEAAFDRITEAAARVFDMPIAAISLVDSDREWFKACVGTDGREGSREIAFCAIAIMRDETLVVRDATDDPRFRDNPQVTENGIRFYAGHPIITSDGQRIGSFCVKDTRPREFDESQRQTLEDITHAVAHMIELRRAGELEIEQRALAEGRACQVEKMESLLSRVERISRTGGWELDVASGEIRWSDETYRIHEVDPSEKPSIERAIEFYAPEARPVIQDAVERGMRDGTPWDLELAFVTARGRRLMVRAMGEAEIRDGRVVRLFGAFQDITEKYRRTDELRQVKERYELSVNGSMNGLWDWQVGTEDVWFSDRFGELLGYFPGELEHKFSVFEGHLHPGDTERVLEAVRVHLDEGAEYDVEYRLRTKSGEYRWFRARGSSTYDGDGNPVRMSGSITDIDDAKRAKAELTQMKQRLDLALGAADVGLWDWNIPTGEVYFNDQWYTMLGLAPSELPMELSTWERLCDPEDLKQAFSEVQRHFEGKTERYVCEQRLRCKDGSWKWILDVGEVVERDGEGEPVRMVGVHIDIDAQKRVQAELNGARTDAEAASRAKSGFLANMSHELRTPLTSIIGFSDILCDDSPEPEGVKEAAGIISTNAKHLLTLINDILDLSKIEAERIELDPVSCEPESFVKDLESMMRGGAEAKGIGFEIEAVYPIARRVRIDQVRVRQILVNLAGNAVKFTSEGRVRVTLSCAPDERGDVALVVRVEDTGIGMDDECLERIFRPFTQGEVSSTRQFGGTGLGLSISRRLAEMMGGRIEVESEAGRGSAFILTVPIDCPNVELIDERQREAEKPVIKDRGESLPSLAGSRILLVEDGKDNQRLLHLLLTQSGAEVEIASDGREGADMAVAALRSGLGFDVLLMDMQMPVLDGYGATRELRAGGFRTPIIALTAYATNEDRDKCLGAGCDDFLTKPIGRADLIECCHAWVRGEKARASKAA